MYDIFFSRDSGQRSLVEILLALTLQRTQALIVELGHADHRKEITTFKSDARFTALTVVSALGIYLHKLLSGKGGIYERHLLLYRQISIGDRHSASGILQTGPRGERTTPSHSAMLI